MLFVGLLKNPRLRRDVDGGEVVGRSCEGMTVIFSLGGIFIFFEQTDLSPK